MNRHSLFRVIEIWQNKDTFCKLDSCFGLPWGSVVKNPPAMQKTCVWFLGQEDPLETGMATHSRIHAWKILYTEEPNGLQSKGSQRVRYNWSNLARTHVGSVGHNWSDLAHTCVGSSSWSKDQTRVPCIGRQTVNHWTTRGVPVLMSFLIISTPGRAWTGPGVEHTYISWLWRLRRAVKETWLNNKGKGTDCQKHWSQLRLFCYFLYYFLLSLMCPYRPGPRRTWEGCKFSGWMWRLD